MNPDTATADALVELLAHRGLSLTDAAALLEGQLGGPTVTDFMPVVIAAATPGAHKTYRHYWDCFAAEFGDRPVRSVRTTELRAFALRTQETALRRSNSRNGLSAREHCVGALRAFFRAAVDDDLIDANPATGVEKPKRRPSNRRGFTATEVAELFRVTTTTGDDPILDGLLLRFHLETGARRGGALALRLRDLDRGRQCVRLREKNDTERWQPVSMTLLAALIAHAEARGVTEPDEALFRRKPRAGAVQGVAVSRRRYNTLAERWRKHLPWCCELGVSIHWCRHHATSSIERIAGYAVARAFAGHVSSDETTTTYIKAHLHEVARAVAVYTGEPHPLAEEP